MTAGRAYSPGVRSEKDIALIHDYQKALDLYLRAKTELQMSRRDPVKAQQVEDAMVLLDIAKRAYFRAR